MQNGKTAAIAIFSNTGIQVSVPSSRQAAQKSSIVSFDGKILQDKHRRQRRIRQYAKWVWKIFAKAFTNAFCARQKRPWWTFQGNITREQIYRQETCRSDLRWAIKSMHMHRGDKMSTDSSSYGDEGAKYTMCTLIRAKANRGPSQKTLLPPFH